MARHEPNELLRAFDERGWSSDPVSGILRLAERDPAAVTDLLVRCVERGGTSHTFMDAALSFVPDADLNPLARRAVDGFGSDRKNEAAEGLLAQMSLQAPASLEPFLDRLWEHRPNQRTYYRWYPWRGAGDAEVARLLTLADRGDAAVKNEVANCIAETREQRYIEQASQRGCVVLPKLYYVGLAAQGRKLYADINYHLRFPGDFFANDDHQAVWRRHEPSWKGAAVRGSARFGGLAEGICNYCGKQLHNMLDLEHVPAGIPVSLKRMQVVTCLSCQGWSDPVLFFEHDARGVPRALGGAPAEPQFPAEPFAETRVELVDTPPRYRWQDWAMSNSRENLHRLGGYPCWVQDSDYAECFGCKQPMTALLQLDSNLPHPKHGEWLWGSGGISYFLWCDACRISAALWQCT